MAIALVSACAPPPDEDAAAYSALLVGDEAAAPPLYDDLGQHHYQISTEVPRAQQFFDQGLRLTYAFNHAEAIRAFKEAARLDPDCAICYWGIALAYGPNINAPMDSASGVEAYRALERAGSVADGASPSERELIEALGHRYAEVPLADRASLDLAYANAMGEVAGQYPDDADIATLSAEARMTTRPWNYWAKSGEPHPGTANMVATLERVIARNPDHPGACHYYIHAVEAVEPEKAVACAERLAQLMPGAGHLVHMPGHIYIRVGRWDDAIQANHHAVHADQGYIADQGPSGVYPIAYYPHNYHFLAFAAAMVGRSSEAIEAARAVVENVPVEVARQVPPVEPLTVYHHLTLLTFGRWDEVLSTPAPPSDLRFATGMVTYAQGVAHAAKGSWPQAEAALDSVRGISSEPHGELNQALLQIAAHSLAGEIAFRGNRLAEAEQHFRAAMQVEDALLYIEPPSWYFPARHSLGAVLMRAGQVEEAERIYREDLQRFPENGWSLYGLQASLEAQGRTEAAKEAARRFEKSWHAADVELAASRF
jgi:tetratricopeptide (TPR) repeat protein